MRYFLSFIVFFLLSLLITPPSASAQKNADIKKDTNLSQNKVVTKDSLDLKRKDSLHAKPSKAVLDSKVDYHARDSMRLDAANRKVYLYGDASVKYQDLELKAAYIEIALDSNIAYARGVQDSGKTKGTPEFHQGSDVFYAQTMRYNFKSKKGRINQIRTKEGEGYVYGETVKKDTGNVYYLKTGRYTTCSLGLDGDPHFYIAAVRLKVIPHQEIITGPADLVIEGVPTPLAIPFGFFPLSTGRHSGILIPTYGESQNQGFFLQNGGYYFGLSDHVTMQVRGDIYTYGSWALRDIVDYGTRYQYTGSFNLAYSDTRLEIPGTPNYSSSRNYFIIWDHRQDPKASPNSTFSASVNAGSSNYFTYNSFNPTAYLQNTFTSNIAYTHNFAQTPFHLSLNAEHSQNTINKSIQITLPELTLTADRMYPAKWFEANPVLSSSKWYNTISFGFTTNASNRINTYDSLLFKPKTLSQMQNGVNTSIPVTASFRIFKYITFTPSFNFSSIQYFQTVRETWNNVRDSIEKDTIQGLRTVNTYNASATLSTNVYAMYSLGLKKAIIIRQVFYPSIGFSYHPDYSNSHYGYYQSVQYEEGNSANNKQLYSIFQNGIYGGPGIGQAGALNFSLGSNLEMKLRKHTDSGIVYKKMTLLERISIGTSYNFLADSFKLSNFSLSGSTTLFKKVALNFSGNMDPYRLNVERTRDTDELAINHGGYLGRLTSADFSVSTTITPISKTQNKSGASASSNNANSGGGIQFVSPDQYMFYEAMRPAFYAPLQLSSWSITVFYNLVYTQVLSATQPPLTQSLTFNGSAQVTKYWYMSLYSGYDFVGHQFTTTSVSLRRDMHCWEMAFTAVPFGFHQSFSVDIHVKASVLQDLKLSRKRDWEDTQQYGQ